MTVHINPELAAARDGNRASRIRVAPTLVGLIGGGVIGSQIP